MPLTAITTVLSGVSTAIDIAKSIKDIEKSMEASEYKLKISNLVGALADAKIAIIDIQDALRRKDEEIKQLTNDLKFNKNVIRHNTFYYEVDENNKPIGEAYCSLCFEKDTKTIHIVQHPSQRMMGVCPNCKTVSRYPAPIHG